MISLVTRLFAPLVWRVPVRAREKLLDFARAERASMLELVLAAERTRAPRRAALYLAHAADERRHARIFRARALALGAEHTADVDHADDHALYERLGEAGFLAFVCVGERRGLRQLGAHRDFFARAHDTRMTALFDGVLEDERRHAQYTWEELVREVGDERRACAALRRAHVRDVVLAYRRTARVIASRLYRASMTLVYVLCVPFVLVARIVAPTKPR